MSIFYHIAVDMFCKNNQLFCTTGAGSTDEAVSKVFFLNANYANFHKFYRFAVLQKCWNTNVCDLRKFAFIRVICVLIALDTASWG